MALQVAPAVDVAPLRAGRPRLLTLDQVVDGALEVGLDRFNMAMLAEHLGVGVATLYQYISGRDELVRRAVSRQVARLPLPADTGQYWGDYIREYALALQDALVSEPRAIAQFAEGGFGFETEVEMVDGFLAVMVLRGFSLAEAVQIVRHTGFIAFGAAVAVARERANAAKGEKTGAAVARAIARSDATLPLMRAATELYTAETGQLAAELLQPFIEKIARQRGETIS
ncbi:MAG: TetR family transcriptional regulator [Polymorphobacter sp.]